MGKTVEGVNTPDFQRNITTIAKELVTMERKALDDQVLCHRARAALGPTHTRELRQPLAECKANTFEPQVLASNDAQS